MRISASIRWEPLLLIVLFASTLAVIAFGLFAWQYPRLRLTEEEYRAIDSMASVAIGCVRENAMAKRDTNVFQIQDIGGVKSGYFTYDVVGGGVAGRWKVFWKINSTTHSPEIERVIRVD